MSYIKPQLATLYDGLPAGNWLYEVKFDGYRMQLHTNKGQPHFYTRSGLDWVKRFSFLKDAIPELPPNVIIDGELVSVEENGRTHFSQLQSDLKTKKQSRLHFYAFDILNLSGADLRPLPQIERKQTLEEILGDVAAPGVSYSQHHTDGAKEMLAQACKMNLEGLIAKNPKAPYRSDRNENWLKLKCVQTGEYVIIGYIKASSGPGVGALRVATKDLKYAGKVGTGFTDKVALALRKRLDSMSVPTAPIKLPKKRDTVWVEPKLIAKVNYRDITDDGMLRHSSFKGLV